MRYPRRPVLLLLYLIAGLLLIRIIAQRSKPFIQVQSSHLKWHYHSWLYALGQSSLLTKQPLVQVVNEHSFDVVFEIRHDPARFVQGSISESPAIVNWAIDHNGPTSAVVASLIHHGDDVHVFRARISHLMLAQSVFTYYIEIGSWKSVEFHSNLFKAGDRPGVLQFGVLGDNQFAAVKFTKILDNLVSTAGHLDAFIHLGDAVQDAASARAWSTDFWDPLDRLRLLNRPWIMLRGNHDAPSSYTSAPRGGDSLGYTSYLIGATNTYIMVLDSNTNSELQDRHVRAALGSNMAQSASRRIVLVHIPPFVEFWDPEPWRSGEKLWGSFVRDKWVPIFQQQHVDLVISGHQHNYQRGSRHGVTYIIAGGAGGTLDHDRVEDYALEDGVTIFQHHFGVLELNHNGGIHWRVFLEDGTLADELIM